MNTDTQNKIENWYTDDSSKDLYIGWDEVDDAYIPYGCLARLVNKFFEPESLFTDDLNNLKHVAIGSKAIGISVLHLHLIKTNKLIKKGGSTHA
jgi:hypothetical protein